MNPEYPFQPQSEPQPQPAPQSPTTPYGNYTVPGYQPQPVPASYAPIQPPSSLQVAPRRNRSLLWIILTIVFIVMTMAASGLAVWAYMNYQEQKTDVDAKLAIARAEATKVQADKDAAAFLQKEKQPNRQFVGPDDYGRLSFDYPKTWSVYVAKDALKGGSYEAYFNPGVVPTVSQKQQFALRVTIEEQDYDKVLQGYAPLIKKGDLTSSSIKADEQNGTRLDGSFTKDIHGSAVLFKIRDKTVTVQSDAATFKPDFEALIQTITFNK